MNDQVFGIHCSNGFREFDSHTTTNIKYEIMLIKLFKGKYVVEIKYYKLIIHIPHTTTKI